MVKFSKRTKLELLVVSSLFVGSCDTHTMAETYDLADVANVNARNALAKCNGLEDRISDIESRLNM